MVNPPLCIVQARLESTRIPRKMLQDVHGKPLLWYGWRASCDLFAYVVIAVPQSDVEEFAKAIPNAWWFGYDGDVNDVLGRFHACAHKYRHHPATTIVRITPDDFPIDPLREQCTLAQLDSWHAHVKDPELREHIGHLYPKRLEINTPEDLEALRLRLR